jgi:Fanconi anemia group M protein
LPPINHPPLFLCISLPNPNPKKKKKHKDCCEFENDINSSFPNNRRRRRNFFNSVSLNLQSSNQSFTKFSLSNFTSLCCSQEFDWEAAVGEIDAACERANNPSSTTINQASSSNFTPPVNILNNSSYYSCTKTGTCKQSTLDKFIGRANPPVKPTVEVRNHQGNGIINSDGRPCCVEIDAEAAKTWIYPGLYHLFLSMLFFINLGWFRRKRCL